MSETYRFVGMLATMQPPYQLLPGDSSPEKVATIFRLGIYFTPSKLRLFIAIHEHIHTPSQHNCLLGKKITLHSL